MARRLRFLFKVFATLAVMLPFASGAEEEMTWYTVEVIVFERTSEIGRNSEAWPAQPGLPSLADAVELSREGLTPEELAGGTSSEAQSESTAQTESELTAQTEAVLTPLTPMPRAFQLVPAEEHRLTDTWKRLKKSSAFRPLLHIAWIQPGFSSEDARLVHLRNSNAALGAVVATSVDESQQGVDSAQDAGGAESAETLPASIDIGFAPTLSPRITVARDPSKAALDGTLRVHRARYLHVQADLLYYRPLASDASAPKAVDDDPDAAPILDSSDTALIEQLLDEDDAAPRLFRMTGSRRMRSRELHYLDHPLFGALVEAWPVELPEAPVAPPQDTLPADNARPADDSGATQPDPLRPVPTEAGTSG